jgi:hypothetical protein
VPFSLVVTFICIASAWVKRANAQHRPRRHLKQPADPQLIRGDAFVVTYVPIIAWIAAILAAAIAIAREQRPLSLPFAADRLLRAVLFFPLGLMSLWAALGHIFMPEIAAKAIGWQPSPFQFEVGVANLGIGLSALYSTFRSREAQLATGLVALGFLGGAGVGHIRDIIATGNLAAGNAGPILFTDFLTPLAILVLLWLARAHKPPSQA